MASCVITSSNSFLTNEETMDSSVEILSGVQVSCAPSPNAPAEFSSGGRGAFGTVVDLRLVGAC